MDRCVCAGKDDGEYGRQALPGKSHGYHLTPFFRSAQLLGPQRESFFSQFIFLQNGDTSYHL